MLKCEGDIVSECLEWLSVNGFFAWRNNTGAVKVGNRYIRYGHVGSADILGVTKDGKILCIECKAAKGRQRDEQKIFERMIKKHGGLYYLVRSLDELIASVTT